MSKAYFTIREVHQGLIKKEFSAEELTKFYFKKIKKEDKKISAFLFLTENLALSQAKEVDLMISKKEKIPLLAGVPFAIKDNILIKDIKCTAASKILENYISPYEATVIKKLKEQKAIILGKTNLDEFAMGSSTENSAFFPTKNPCDLNRVPGGTSGGSAAAVAADMAVAALGSDTGGSIRQPASFCGIVGLKPTYGAVSRFGLIAHASSLDQIGPLTKTIEDAKIVFDVISEKDEMDSTSVNSKFKSSIIRSGATAETGQNSKLQFKIQNLKIGLPKEYFIKGMDLEVEKIIKNAIKKYEEMGIRIKEISLPHTEYALPCYYIIVFSEASANLARYDGIRFGFKANSEIKNQKSKIKNLLDVYLYSREEGFGNEVKRRVMLGTYALSSGYYEAFYLRAQKVRTKIKSDFEKAFESVDLILTPVSPTPAFKLGEKINNPLQMYLSDIFTVSANLTGLPGLSFPCGRIGNLPVGLQLIGKPFEEEKIFQIAEFLEKN